MKYRIFKHKVVEKYKVLDEAGSFYMFPTLELANEHIAKNGSEWEEIKPDPVEEFAAILAKDWIVFEDAEFNKLLNKWNNEVVKARHGRKKTKAQLEMLFMGRTINASYSALKYAYEQKLVTINFDYVKRTTEFKGTNRPGNDAGGTRDNTLGQPRGTEETATTISKRVTRLGE